MNHFSLIGIGCLLAAFICAIVMLGFELIAPSPADIVDYPSRAAETLNRLGAHLDRRMRFFVVVGIWMFVALGFIVLGMITGK